MSKGTNGFGDVGCILSVCSVPVATIKDSHGIIVNGRQRLEKADETALIVKLKMRWLVNGALS